MLLGKICEYAVQQLNGRHTMVGIVDNIVAPEFPLDHPPMALCVQLEFEPDEARQPLRIQTIFMDQDGKVLFDVAAEGQVPTPGGPGAFRLFMHVGIPPLRIERPGDHRLDIVVNGTKMGEERIPVVQAGSAAV